MIGVVMRNFVSDTFRASCFVLRASWFRTRLQTHHISLLPKFWFVFWQNFLQYAIYSGEILPKSCTKFEQNRSALGLETGSRTTEARSTKHEARIKTQDFKNNLTRLIIIFLFFSSPIFAAKPSNFIVAKINNKAITNSEIEERYRFVLLASGIRIKNAYDQKMLRQQIIDKMADEELIRQEAQNLKIEAEENEIKNAIEIIALQRKQNPAQFRFFFIQHGLSFDNYIRQIETEVLWSKIMTEILRSRVKVSDVEIREFFEQHKFDTDVRKFLIAEILISSGKNADQLAEKLVLELRHGANFNDIVRQFSSSFTAENSGKIGWVSQGDIDVKVYNAISKMGKGGYSEPVLLNDGYHIFKLLDAKVETKISDHDLNTAKTAIFNRKLQIMAKGYLMDLRKKAFIEISL